MKGYLRSDGRKGIRNIILVSYTVECSHYVADRIVREYSSPDVQLFGFSGCAPNAYATRLMSKILTHPNVGGVLLVSLGCENMDLNYLSETVSSSGRPARVLSIQENGGTRSSISLGLQYLSELVSELSSKTEVVDFTYKDLVVGTICGGSDATSGLTANPSVGLVFDRLSSLGATCIFEEPGELIGCEYMLSSRASSSALSSRLLEVIWKADSYYKRMGCDSFSAGNSTGGLSTIEEKSLGSYCKSGSSEINGIIIPGEEPPCPGLYLMDVVPEGDVKWSFPNPNDNSEIIELISCGCHLILFTTGRGSVVGSAVSPVIKICGNPRTCLRMPDDIDVNAGKIIDGLSGLNDIRDEILLMIEGVCSGVQTKSESLGHHEFYLGYKEFKRC